MRRLRPLPLDPDRRSGGELRARLRPAPPPRPPPSRPVPALPRAHRPDGPDRSTRFSSSRRPTPARPTRPGVQRLRQIGLDRGFTIEATSDASVVNAEDLPRFRAVAFLNTKGDLLDRRPAGRLRDLLPRRRRLPRSRLGDRDRARLGVPDRAARHPCHQPDRRARPAPSRWRTACTSATKNLPEYWTRTDAWYNFAANVRGVSHVPGHGRGEALHPAAVRCHAQRDRRHHGRRPPGRLVQGLPGRPVLLHLRQHRRDQHRDRVRRSRRRGAGVDLRCRGQRLQRLRRDGARQLRADQDQRAPEPERAHRLRPASRTAGSSRPPRGGQVRLHDPAIGTEQVIATIPVYTNSEDGLYGPRSTTTSPPTTGSTSTTPRRPSR